MSLIEDTGLEFILKPIRQAGAEAACQRTVNLENDTRTESDAHGDNASHEDRGIAGKTYQPLGELVFWQCKALANIQVHFGLESESAIDTGIKFL